MPRINLNLSSDAVEKLKELQHENGLKTQTAAIEFILERHGGIIHLRQELEKHEHFLQLLTKHINELRRNDYLVIDLLNAITIKMDVFNVPMHHELAFRSPALVAAYGNLAAFMRDVMVRIKTDKKKGISYPADVPSLGEDNE